MMKLAIPYNTPVVLTVHALNFHTQHTGHTLPLKVIGFGTPFPIRELKVKLSPPASPVLYLPNGQLLGFPSYDVDDRRRQKMN